MSDEGDKIESLELLKAKPGGEKGGDASVGGERCSFCGREKSEVRRLIAGPSVFICDRCVVQCSEIVHKPPR